MTTIKAVIFDMDGVLIEAKEWHYEALNQALELFGHTISREDHLTRFDGLPTSKKLDVLSLERGLPRDLHQTINDQKQIFTKEHIVQKCVPLDIHQEALSTLKSQGYKLAVCSNSVRMTVDMMMDLSDLKQYLEFTLSNEDVLKPKPSPEIYTKAMKRLGLKPQECLVVEDNPIGMKAAVESGAYLLAVETVHDVTLQNIRAKIAEIETASAVQDAQKAQKVGV
jgi:beta-phosphoglucomutase